MLFKNNTNSILLHVTEYACMYFIYSNRTSVIFKMKKLHPYTILFFILSSKRIWSLLFCISMISSLSAHKPDSLLSNSKSPSSEITHHYIPSNKNLSDLSGKLFLSEGAYIVSGDTFDGKSTSAVKGKIFVSHSDVLFLENKDNTKSFAKKVSTPKQEQKTALAKKRIHHTGNTAKKDAQSSANNIKFSVGTDKTRFSYNRTLEMSVTLIPSSQFKDKYTKSIHLYPIKTQFYIQISKDRFHYREERCHTECYTANSDRAPPFYS